MNSLRPTSAEVYAKLIITLENDLQSSFVIKTHLGMFGTEGALTVSQQRAQPGPSMPVSTSQGTRRHAFLRRTRFTG